MEQFFAICGEPAPRRTFGESPEQHRQRCLAVAIPMLPKGHVLKSVNPYRQPAAALPGLEGLAYDQAVEDFKAPRGPERSWIERDQSGREITHFAADPEAIWGRYKCETRRATFTEGLGRGADSPHARAERAAAEHEMGLAYQALDAQRAAGL